MYASGLIRTYLDIFGQIHLRSYIYIYIYVLYICERITHKLMLRKNHLGDTEHDRKAEVDEKLEKIVRVREYHFLFPFGSLNWSGKLGEITPSV